MLMCWACVGDPSAVLAPLEYALTLLGSRVDNLVFCAVL